MPIVNAQPGVPVKEEHRVFDLQPVDILYEEWGPYRVWEGIYMDVNNVQHLEACIALDKEQALRNLSRFGKVVFLIALGDLLNEFFVPNHSHVQ